MIFRRLSQMYVRVVLLCLITSISYLNYWVYNQTFQKDSNAYLDVLNGTAPAPQQYRVLVVRAGWWLHQHAHLGLRHAFGLFDFIGATGSAFILLALMERSAFFRDASQIERLFSYAVFLFLEAYYLLWIDWYQRPETLPTALFVAMMLAVISWPWRRKATLVLMAAGTILLTIAQALTRADVAFCFYSGMFLSACRSSSALAFPRKYAIPLTASAALVAVLVQAIMSRKIYPRATYGDTAVIQLLMNMGPLSLVPFLLFVFPVAWAAWYALRKQVLLEYSWTALLYASAIFAGLWCVVGRLQEVRIFLPFSLALIPLTVSCVVAASREYRATANEV